MANNQAINQARLRAKHDDDLGAKERLEEMDAELTTLTAMAKAKVEEITAKLSTIQPIPHINAVLALITTMVQEEEDIIIPPAVERRPRKKRRVEAEETT